MALANWSGRRIGLILAAGIALQIAVMVLPLVSATRRARSDGPRIHRERLARESYLKEADRADSISRQMQMARAREAGEYRVNRRGETTFAVVGMPSGRVDPATAAAMRASIQRVAYVFVGIQLGAIPLALLGLTLAWGLAQRNRLPAPV